jgi:U3 small nucleolar RNA-associated protein 7
MRDKKLKSQLSRAFVHAKESAVEAARTELLLPDEAGCANNSPLCLFTHVVLLSFMEPESEMEKTFKVTQAHLKSVLPAQVADKSFSLSLPTHGPYQLDLTRDGRYFALAGERGHLALFDRLSSRLHCELFVNEAVRDVQFLHNSTMFAAAQKRFTYIYDSKGTELHCVRPLIDCTRLDFLPYHYLLAAVGNAGYLKYLDVSSGFLVAEHRTKLGPCSVLRQNPRNAVIHLGHSNGTVTLWTPNLKEAVVSIFVGRGAVQALAVDPAGNYMATAGIDGRVRVYDVRTYQSLYSYNVPGRIASLDISQRGVLAIGFGTHVHLYAGGALAQRQSALYMSHHIAGSPVQHVQFAPYDDVLCIGHETGVANIVVPGSGEPNFDTYVASPYETKKQMREREVHSLLEKIQPNLISLEDVLGKVAVVRRGGAAAAQKQRAGDDNDDAEVADDDNAVAEESSEEPDPDRLEFEPVKLRKKTAIGRKNSEARLAAKKSVIRQERISTALTKRNVERVLGERAGAAKATAGVADDADQQTAQAARPATVLDRFKRKRAD